MAARGKSHDGRGRGLSDAARDRDAPLRIWTAVMGSSRNFGSLSRLPNRTHGAWALARDLVVGDLAHGPLLVVLEVDVVRATGQRRTARRDEAVDRVAHLDVVRKGSNPSLGSHGVRSRLRGTLQI